MADSPSTSPGPLPPPPDRLVRAAVAGAIALVFALVLVALVVLLRQLLAVVLLGIVVGTTLGPLVDRLASYRMPRILTGLGVYAVIAGAITLFFWYAIPELINEGKELGEKLEEFEADYNRLVDESFLPPSDELLDVVQRQLSGMGPSIVGQAMTLFSTLLYTFTVLAVGLFWTVTRQPAIQLFLSLVEPWRRKRAEEVLMILDSRLRHFVFAEFIGMSAVAVLTYVALTIIGMDFAFILATIAFIFEILPILGPWLAYLPALAVALTESWEMAIAVSVVYLAIQQIESYAILPFVQRRGTKMPEVLILVAVLFGGALMGILGALVAIPVAVILHTLFMEVFVPWRHGQINRAVQRADAEAEADTEAPTQEDELAAGLERLDGEDGAGLPVKPGGEL